MSIEKAKMDVIDFLISALRDSIEELNNAIGRLEDMIEKTKPQNRTSPSPETPQPMSGRNIEEKMTETRTEEAEEREEIIPPETSQPRISPLAEEPMTETRHYEVGGRERDYWECEEKMILFRVLDYINKNQFASISDITRNFFDLNRNWLAGFLSGLYACGLVALRGTATHKLYSLTLEGIDYLKRMKGVED
ncbi:MAG: hypothetical protein DRP01_01690 [Archaeoglobales archaeon]|nr:MAG: hypothetical protein DRP01_01690 [Archaeoglobales archaeon]